MPLNLAELNKHYIIQKICGQEKIRHHLETLGIIAGCEIIVLSELSEYYVVVVKGSKFGLDKRLAQKIIIMAE
ncbi:MAG: FeoA family protein [Lachnospiraceae bacterium]|nr:FeoA family protein [Lachnospiraceae bacterium]